MWQFGRTHATCSKDAVFPLLFFLFCSINLNPFEKPHHHATLFEARFAWSFFCRSADYFSTFCVLFNLRNDDQYFLSRLTLKPYHDSLAVANRTPKKYCFNHVHGSKSRLKSVRPIKRIKEPVLLVETRFREHSVFLLTLLIFIQQNTIIFIWSFLVYLCKEIISRINYSSSLRLLLFLYGYCDWSSNLQTFNIESTLRLN